MKFFLSSYKDGIGIDVGEFAGIIASPADYGIRRAIQSGAPWIGDNNAYGKGFRPKKFFPWLEAMEPYREQCLFIVPPDDVGNAAQTLSLFRTWIFHLIDWPLAFVAQDGQENYPFPCSSTWIALFVGGTTKWKESYAAIEVIKRAQALAKHIHIGRVNYRRRYMLFRQIKGSEGFTCDGTRQRYDGMEKTRKDWAEYQKALALPLW